MSEYGRTRPNLGRTDPPLGKLGGATPTPCFAASAMAALPDDESPRGHSLRAAWAVGCPTQPCCEAAGVPFFGCPRHGAGTRHWTKWELQQLCIARTRKLANASFTRKRSRSKPKNPRWRSRGRHRTAAWARSLCMCAGILGLAWGACHDVVQVGRARLATGAASKWTQAAHSALAGDISYRGSGIGTPHCRLQRMPMQVTRSSALRRI